jgi:hypothetical protein
LRLNLDCAAFAVAGGGVEFWAMMRLQTTTHSLQMGLGHSDPSLTAGVYTDVAALELHGEVGKLPWFGQKSGDAVDSQIDPKTPQKRDFRAVLSELIQMAEAAIKSQDAKTETPVSDFLNGARDRTRTCTPYGKGF